MPTKGGYDQLDNSESSNEDVKMAKSSSNDHFLNLLSSNKGSQGASSDLRHTFADFRQDPPKMRTKAFLYIILSLIGVAYSFTCLITGCLAYSHIGKNPLALSNLISNWKTLPITDIKAIEGDVCTNGYQPMITRYWPGTKAGCDCDGTITEGNDCGSDCTTVKAVSKIMMSNFHESKICIKRSGKDIINSLRPNPDDPTDCGNGDETIAEDYKPCGNGDSSHEICVLKSDPCPVDNIAINTDTTQENYTSVELGDGYYLHFTTESNLLPIVDFDLTEGYVCIFPDEYDKTDGREYYELLKMWKYNGCGSQIGDLRYDNEGRWNEIANITESELFEQNVEVSEAIEDLPEYEITDSVFSLYYRTYIDWTLECQRSSEAPMDKIAEDNNPINTLANVQLLYIIIALLTVLVIGIISPGFVVYKQAGVLMGKREQDEDLIASNGMRLISGILVVLNLCFLVAAIIIISNFNSIVDYVEEHD